MPSILEIMLGNETQWLLRLLKISMKGPENLNVPEFKWGIVLHSLAGIVPECC